MERFRPGERTPYVRRLRDKAVEIVDSIGQWHSPVVGDKTIPTRGAEFQTLSILYTTPFQKFDRRAYKMPAGANDLEAYSRALLHAKTSNRPVAFILDIWLPSGKVFSAAWDGPDKFEIVTFKRGDWEDVLLSIISVGDAENNPGDAK